VKAFVGTVIGRRELSPHLVSVTLGGLEGWQSTGIADEYVRLLLPPNDIDEVQLPVIGDDWSFSYPVGATELVPRVYTVSDYRLVDADMRIDVDVVLHDAGPGAAWAKNCLPGDQVGVLEPHGLYRPDPQARKQLLVCDLTAVPAAARILRELPTDHQAYVHVVITDPADEMPLPTTANSSVTWQVVDSELQVADAMTEAVRDFALPKDSTGWYVWLAGEAHASRAVRKYLRRELNWPQSAFYTCGYWQLDAERWKARYEVVADEVNALAAAAFERVGGEEGAYLDELDQIYESVGL